MYFELIQIFGTKTEDSNNKDSKNLSLQKSSNSKISTDLKCHCENVQL